MAKIAKLQKEVDGVLNTIYPSTITEAVINIESSKSLKDELTDINNAVSSKVDISSISTVATSGDYNDLNNKPVIPSSTSELTNDSNYITSSEVDTKINSAVAAVYKVRGSVDNYESLPISNVAVGDVYNLLDTGSNYVCISIDPIIWDKLSETIDLSAYSTTEENNAKYQLKGNYITSIPDEYVTDTELEAKGYATVTSVEAALATKLDSSTYTAATSTTSGYMSSEDYIKLSGIEENADVNIIESITVNGDAVSVTNKTAAIEVNETHGVLLDEVPTDTTLTYQDGDKVKSFTIGMSAIYPDDSSDDGLGISFFKGIDSEGNAIWGVGGGGVSSEKVTITLDTNQADKTFLIGTDITLSYGEIINTYTWDGTAITASIPANFTYTISTAEDTNNEYTVINSGELTAVAGATRTVTIYRNTTVTSFNVSKNNAYDWAFPSDVTVTLTGTGDYSSYSKVLSGALTYDNIKIPTNTTYNVTVSNLDGTRYHYIAPVISTKTASNPSESVSIEYVGRTLTINHSTTENTCSPTLTVSYTGAITNSDSFTPTLTSTVTSTLIVLPDNTNYSITGDEIATFETPSFPITGTINSQDSSVSIVYSFLSEEVYASWVIFDDSSSTTVLETGGNKDIINGITANFKRCLAKPQSDGSAAITYLDPSNSNYFADGSSTSSYTSGYNWMVHFPKYYYKCEQDSSNTSKWKLFISDRKINDSYKEERECLIGIFEAYNSSSKLYSRPGVASTGSITITDFFTYAQANGTNWGLIDYRAHKTIANMFACKYGNTNISTSNSSIPCSGGTKAYNSGNTGKTLSLGNSDGLNSGSSNFLGIEDCYYGKWEFVQGINIVADRTWVVYDGGLKVDTTAANLISAGYTNVRTIGTGYSSDGWITGISHGEYADVMPTAASGGSDTTYYADYYYQNTGNKIFRRSGTSSFGSHCGVFCSFASNASSDSYADLGSRLGFYGTINVYDTDAWKAL